MPLNDPNGPDEQSTPQSEDELFAKEFEQAWHQLKQEDRTGKICDDTKDAVRDAVAPRVDFLDDPVHAGRLAARHNQHLLTGDIADAMYDATFMLGKERIDAIARLEQLNKRAKEHGVFVFPYDEEYERMRMEGRHEDGSRKYVIAEAWGTHPRRGFVPGADAQIALPAANRHAAPVFSVPLGSDTVPRDKLLEEMLEFPESVAQIDDVVTELDMQRKGLASRAMEAALVRIRDEINPTRGDHAIKIVTAEIVSVRGMRLKEKGHELFLDHEVPGERIMNSRSMIVFDHLRSDVVAAFDDVWVLKNRFVPVHGHPHVEGLIVNWYVKAARVRP